MDRAQETVQTLASHAGIHINGPASWDIQVHNNQFYPRLLRDESLGLGESYMEKWWDCEALDVFIERMLRARLYNKFHFSPHTYLQLFWYKFFNLQTKRRAKQVADVHYNLGNQLFSAMLDKRMIYSCGYWKDATTLDEAQEAKLNLICKKLQLQPGQRLLDVGCGWGGLAKFAAENYGVEVTGVTISEAQYQYGVDYCRGLPVNILLQDYRDIQGKFDRIVSVGMFEHVGAKNYPIFMSVMNERLTDDGLFLLHTIGGNVKTLAAEPWIAKYIFPNGLIPTIPAISLAAQNYFIMEDWHNFGVDYDRTLLAWYQNFAAHWEELKDHYDERFYRMWRYYLLSCAGSFRARDNQLWQIVFSKYGTKRGYNSVR